LTLGRTERQAILLAGDLLLACAAAALALRLGGRRSGWIWSERDFAWDLLGWLLLLLPLWLSLAWANGLYDLRRMADRWAAALMPVAISAQLLLIWALAYFVPPPWTIVRHVVVFFAAGTALTLPFWRILYGRIFGRGAFRSRLLVVGAGASGRSLLAAARAEAAHWIDPEGFIDDDPALAGATVDGLPVLGGRAALLPVARARGVSEIALAISSGLHADLFAALMSAQEQGITITPMPLLYERLTGRLPVEHVGDQWAVSLPLQSSDADALYRLLRRSFDLSCALLGLILLTLLLPFLALLIRLDSPGPIFYRQTRLGRGGRPFTLYKLRSMVEGAEPEGPVWATADDPRATRVGRWLRRSRLDELPQAINILRGEMSVIGPRPERPELVEQLATEIPFYRARHAIRPGLTGWATVRQGYASNPTDALLKLQHDLYYIKHRSLLLDLRILLQTAAEVLRLAGR
jgi:exopolysaccharide biosynthesis polyprenyl glycosylphosphotransferase